MGPATPEEPPKPRILVVDDVPDAREILSATLAAYGMGVETSDDGLQALERIEAWRPDAVLLDLSLPKLDGFQVARRLSADPRFSELPLVAYTAHGSPEHRQRAIEAGCAAVLVKPTPNPVLVEILRQVIDSPDLKPQAEDVELDQTATRLLERQEAHSSALPAMAGDLAREWRQTRTSGDSLDVIAPLCARVHRFVASCSRCGFELLCLAAVELERVLEDYLRQPADRQRHRVDRQVERLEELAAREARLTGPAPAAPGEGAQES